MLKKNILLGLLFLSSATLLFSQQLNHYHSTYYNIKTPFSGTENRYLSEKLDAIALYFNSFFHFDLQAFLNSGKKFNIEIYANKTDFLNKLNRSAQTTNSFIYLKSPNGKNDTLYGYVDSSKNFNQIMQHYLFIQFLRTFINAPPLWLEKGFALYFEKSKYNKSKKEFIHKSNYTWLETLRKMSSNSIQQENHLIPLQLFLTMDESKIEKRIHSFYAQSWGFVNFLLNAPNPIYNRVIWDSIRGLSPNGSRSENENICITVFNWLNTNLFYKDFYDFNKTLSSFPELIEKAISSFNQKKYEEAKNYFHNAIKMDDENYIIYYYLGLIYYNQKDYQMANYYYHCALEQKSEDALCYYALGLSSFYQKEYEQSVTYLNKAISINKQFLPLAKEILDVIH